MVVTYHEAGNDKMAQKTAIDIHKAINTKGEKTSKLKNPEIGVLGT